MGVTHLLLPQVLFQAGISMPFKGLLLPTLYLFRNYVPGLKYLVDTTIGLDVNWIPVELLPKVLRQLLYSPQGCFTRFYGIRASDDQRPNARLCEFQPWTLEVNHL